MGIRNQGQRPSRSVMTDDTPASTPRSSSSAASSCSAPPCSEPGAVFVDATLGMGGHSAGILERFPEADPGRPRPRPRGAGDRGGAARALRRPRPPRAHGLRRHPRGARRPRASTTVDGVLFDLGVSSLQLDRVERGFSYSKDAPLDMRMDATSELTAETILAEYSEADLRRIFRDYGEEKLAGRYAQRIVEARADRSRSCAPASSSTSSRKATPVAVQRQGHPAKRVFQALRIEVNQELAVLRARHPRGDRRARRRRPDRRRGLPVARGPHRQARAAGAIDLERARPGCRSSCPSTGRN